MPTAVVVDDTAADRLLAETLLKHAGYTVTMCADGLDGLDLINRAHPDLVVADLITPGIDGYDLARALRGDPSTASTPIILQTAHYLEADVRRLAAQIGVMHVVIKPYEPRVFLDTLAMAVRDKPTVPRSADLAATEFHADHLRVVSGKLHEKVRELDSARHEFEVTASRYRTLFRVHPEPMWVFNVETLRFLEVNDAAIRGYGYTRDEFLAMTIDKIHPPDEMPSVLQSLHEPADSDKSTAGRHQLKNGTVIEVEVSTRDLGKGSRYVMAQDVTDKQKYQRQLHQAQRMESLGQLAGGVAHDFNNLLGVIINFSWFVKANLTAEVESGNGERLRPVLKDIERIERAAENAARLTHQLLAFARVDVVQPRAMDMNVVVSEMAPMLRRTLGEHIELIAAPVPTLLRVIIDSGQLSQVLTNLAVNSRDAMPKGGKLTIDLANVDVDMAYAAARPALTPGRYVRLRVSDTGAGMDKKTLEHAFEPFFTTKPRGEGTGLGLATVYGIVTQAGGTIEVYSEPGLGTRVSVLLPATEQVPSVVAPQSNGHAPATETVLVVEDSEDLREIVDRILSAHGYRVVVASSGPDALNVARDYSGHIDLLLTDVIMPQMQGNELAERLVADRADLRVLFMSGFAQPALTANGTLAPEIALLDKPFNEATLLTRIRQVLDVAK